VDEQAFQQIVDATYESLYRFALSLTHAEADACDLTQETFRRFAARGDQIRDASKTKTWLFTTLYRRYVTLWRRENKFPHFELSVVATDLPAAPPPAGEALDAATVRDALNKLDDLYRLPLLLFYLEDHTYAEIAQILEIPCGTVMSRIARGRQQLREQLRERNALLISIVS
jgi:RNA polymerase sigma-70 factor (ECF subfamily)